MQPTLLRVLERRGPSGVWAARSDVQVDVRVIAATHRDLRAEANAGHASAPISTSGSRSRASSIPPLRERPEDIDPLVAHFAAEITGAPGLALLARRR